MHRVLPILPTPVGSGPPLTLGESVFLAYRQQNTLKEASRKSAHCSVRGTRMSETAGMAYLGSIREQYFTDAAPRREFRERGRWGLKPTIYRKKRGSGLGHTRLFPCKVMFPCKIPGDGRNE